MDICLICLRTDRLLNLASNVLEEFHDELCDFSVDTITSSCYYCGECEYIMTKFYEFKEKCVKALNIYQKWKSTKAANKQPINLLYTLLQAAPLGVLTLNPEKTASFTLQPTDSQTDVCIEDEFVKDTFKEVKIEHDQIYSIDNSGTLPDVLKIEFVTENVTKSERIDETLNDGTSEKHSSDNLEEVDDPEECTVLKIAKHDTTDSEDEPKSKKTSKKKCVKKKEKLIENVIKTKKRPSKKVTARKKAQHDKVIENDKMYESVFDVEYLTTLEMRLEEFQRRKTYECYVKAEHKCEICYQVFKSVNYLKYHTNKWHKESAGSVYCSICKIWNSKRSNHRLTHSVVFKCKLCPLVTYHRESMHNHFEQHKGKQYRCEECNITCKSKSVYRTHMGKVHRRGRNICSGCGRGFRSPTGLAIHKSSSSRCTLSKDTDVPTEVEGVRCDECDVTLLSQQVYEAHVADVHDPSRYNGRPFTVNSAGLPEPRILTSLARKARKVKRIRRPPVRNTCRVCNKVGTSFGWLHLHFKREHPNEDMNVLYADKKTHLCDICGTGFSNVYSLRDHMNIHTGARPYACDICPKQFRNAYLMRAHRVRHFPSTIPCTHCGKTFKTMGNLYWHMKTHTDEKSHKCDICGKAFLYVVNLKEHVRGVHYNIRRPKRGGTRQGAADTAPEYGAKRAKLTAEADISDFGDSD